MRSTQVAYAGLMPGSDYLETLSVADWTLRWQGILANEANATFVAEDESRIVGFAGIGSGLNRDGLGADIGEVRVIYVDPGHWRRGVGSALMDAAESRLAEDYSGAILWVLEANDRARRFYESRGWSPDGATKQLDGTQLLEVRYARSLAAKVDPQGTPA